MKKNTGTMPPEAAGKRVYVVLRNGNDNRKLPTETAPPGWPADGRGACRWSLTGSDVDIIEYEVIK